MSWNYGSSYGNCRKSEKFALVAKPLGMARKLSQMVRLASSQSWWLTGPSVGVSRPWMDSPGECAPLSLENCALVIPQSKSAEMCLKMIASTYCEMGWEGFPGSDLMIAREPRMCPPKVPHSQCVENASQMIPPSEFDEEPGKRCMLPSSQLGRRGISELSLDGTSQSTEPPQKLCPHLE
jgi:hypothetical protein